MNIRNINMKCNYVYLSVQKKNAKIKLTNISKDSKNNIKQGMFKKIILLMAKFSKSKQLNIITNNHVHCTCSKTSVYKQAQA